MFSYEFITPVDDSHGVRLSLVNTLLGHGVFCADIKLPDAFAFVPAANMDIATQLENAVFS